MFKQRIINRLFLIFLVFTLLLIIPFAITIRKEVTTIIAEEERSILPYPEEAKDIHAKFSARITDTIMVFSFYAFVFALVMSLYFSRTLLKPLRDLYKGAKALKEGNLGVRLDMTTNDELGEVIESFNEMAVALEKKTAELKKTELYVSAMMDPLWVVDKNDIITDINPAFTKLFGYSRDEVIGASIYDFLDEENTRIMKYQLNEREKGISSIYEISVIAKDGSLIPVLITGAPIIEKGMTTDKIGILKDFRREHELRNELQESRDYIATIMDSIDDELLVVNREFKIVMANRAVKSRTGEKCIGGYCYSISHAMSVPCWHEGEDCPVKRVFETGRISKAVHRHKTASGKGHFYEIIACPIKDSMGNVAHVIELLRDVTEREEYEQNIAEKNRELTVINNIAGILGKSLKTEEIFSGIIDRLIELMNMDGGIIFLIDDTNRELACSYHKGISDKFMAVSGRIKLGDDIPGKVAATGQILITSDIGTDHRIERSILKHSGIKGYCAIPIKGKERIVGVFCLFSFKTHIFTSEEERLMTSIGGMTGIAIENIRLYEQMRQLYEYQRNRRADDHKNLLSLSSGLASAIDMDTVISSTLALVKGFLRADFAWLLELENSNLVLKTASGLSIKKEEIIYQKNTSSIEWYSIEKKEPILVPSIQSEIRFYLSDHIVTKYRSAVCIPVFVGEKTLGAFTLYYTIAREFKEEDIYFLQIVSSILAVAIERASLYKKNLLEKEMSDTILQSISDGIMTVDTKCNIISINKSAADMIGISKERIAGNQCCSIFNYTDENTDFRWAIGSCLDSALEKRPASVETQLTTTTGSRLSIMLNSSPIINSKGEVTGVVHVLRNISMEKEIDRMKTEFVKAVSLQFRTPLSAILGMTEMLINEEVEGEKAREYLQTMHSEGARLSEMVATLLNIARIENGKELFTENNIDFASLFEDTKKLFSSVIEKKECKFSYAIKGDIAGFRGNKERLSSLIRNLVENSLNYSDKGCAVNIILSKKADAIELKVSDNGWGIPDKDIPHLTEEFYRGRYSQKVKGSGLGLSLCKEVVAKHGGTIAFDSKMGKGTTVTVTLPFRRSA